MDPAGDDMLDEALDGRLIHCPIPRQRCGKRGQYAAKLLELEHVLRLAADLSAVARK